MKRENSLDFEDHGCLVKAKVTGFHDQFGFGSFQMGASIRNDSVGVTESAVGNDGVER